MTLPEQICRSGVSRESSGIEASYRLNSAAAAPQQLFETDKRSAVRWNELLGSDSVAIGDNSKRHSTDLLIFFETYRDAGAALLGSIVK